MCGEARGCRLLRPSTSGARMDTPTRPTKRRTNAAAPTQPQSPSPLNSAARDALLARIGDMARSFIPRRMQRDAAADIVQMVVIRCWERMEEGSWAATEDSLKALVRSMVRRRVVDALRRNKRRKAREAEFARELTESTHAWMSPELTREERELEALHDVIVAEIPEARLRAYVMVRGDGVAYAEVAVRLGLSPRSVASHVLRVQRRFRERLKKHGIHAPSRYTSAAAAASRSRAGRRAGAGTPVDRGR